MTDFIPSQSPLTEARDFPLEADDLGLSQINPVPQQHSPHFNLDHDYELASITTKKQLLVQPNDSVSTREFSEPKTAGLAVSKNTSSTETRHDLHNLHHAIDAVLKRSMVMYKGSPSTQTLTPTKPTIATSSVIQTLTPVRSSYLSYSTRNSSLNPYSKPGSLEANPYSKPVTLASPQPTVSGSHQKVKSSTASDLANLVQSYRLHSVRPTTEFTLEKTTVHHLEDLKSNKPGGFSSSASNFYPTQSQTASNFYPSQSQNTIPIGYDKAKLDQILAKIGSTQQFSSPSKNTLYSSNINYNNFPSNNNSVRHWDLPQNKNESITRAGQELALNKEYIRESNYQSVNSNLLVQSPLEQRFGSPLTQQQYQHQQQQNKRAVPPKAMKNSYVGEFQNDDDSQLPDDSVLEERVREPVVVEVKPQPQVQKFIQESVRPKKLTKRQEILNEKRSSKQTVRRHEEQSASKANSRYQSPDVRGSTSKLEKERNNLFISPSKPEKSNLLVSPSKTSATHTKNFGNQRATGGSDSSSRFNYMK